MFINYYIRFDNAEQQEVELQLQDLSTLEDPPGDTVNVILEGKEDVCVLDSSDQDENVTKAIKGRRLTCGFNSGDYDVDGTDTNIDVDSFSDGDDGRFRVRLGTGSGPLAVPFLGNLILDDNSEPFQPQPNAVQLRASEGLGNLKDIEFKDGDEIALGHYSIIEYFTMILGRLVTGQEIHVIMNLYEVDTDPDTSHAFFDNYVNALTFETDVDKREDCFTVLTKILESFGCFLTHDNNGWWIIRWDEYDRIGASVLTHRTANFTNAGVFVDYTLENLTKRLAHDQDVLYEGYFMSFDSAQRRYQRRAKSVTHEYKFEQPKEVPCNSGFTRGTVDDDVLPLKTYVPSCWTLKRGWGVNETTPNSEMRIWVRYDVNDNEDARYLVFTPQAASGGEFNYGVSEGVDVHTKDKFEFSVDYSADSDNAVDGPASIGIAAVVLYGVDSSVWILGDNVTSSSDPQVPEWKLTNVDLSTNFDYYQWFFSADSGDEDYTDFRTYSIESTPCPVDGVVKIHLFAANQSGAAIDDFAIRYNNLQFNYIPLVGGTYQRVNGQSHKVTGDNDSRKEITHPMYLSDSPKKLFKGALKKFDGTNYVLTETWSDFGGGLTLQDSKLGKHIVFQWWNQVRKTRTVIETDVQGIKSSAADGIPGMIHRWGIQHGGQETKWFMMTGFRGMDFYKCGWQGVFVETSDLDGDRSYDDDYLFSYIYGG